MNRFFQCNRKYKKLQYFPIKKKNSKGLSKHLTWFPWHFSRISQVKTQICVSHWLSAWVCWVFTLFSHLHLLVFLGFHFHSAEWRIQLFHKNSFFAFNFSHRNCTGKTKSARTKNVYFRIVLETHLHANIHTHTNRATNKTADEENAKGSEQNAWDANSTPRATKRGLTLKESRCKCAQQITSSQVVSLWKRWNYKSFP